MRGIQYAAAYRFHRWRPGVLDRPVKPDDDMGGMTRSQNVIASAAKQSIAQQGSKQEWIASSQGLLAM